MPAPMKSLTLLQPWAWAIAHGGKDVENRGWTTRHRGEVAIHAGLGWDTSAPQHLPLREAWAKAHAGLDPVENPLKRGHVDFQREVGRIVAVARLDGLHRCHPEIGCFRSADVLGWVPFDGSDASAPGWRPRFCSPWGDVPKRSAKPVVHLEITQVRTLAHPVVYTGHQGLRTVPPAVVATLRTRLEVQR